MGTRAPRVPEEFRECLVLLVNLVEGDELVLMGLVEFQESLELRVTVALMGCLVFLVIKVIGETLEEWDHQDPKERMEKGEMLEKLGPEDSQVNQGLEVYWGQRVHQVFLDLQAYGEVMVLMALKATWDLKGNQVLQANKASQELRECLDHRVLSAPQEKREPQGNQVCQACPELTVLLVTQARRGIWELKEIRVPVVLKVLLAILVLVELRAFQESVD